MSFCLTNLSGIVLKAAATAQQLTQDEQLGTVYFLKSKWPSITICNIEKNNQHPNTLFPKTCASK